MWRLMRRFIRGPWRVFPLPVKLREYPYDFGPPYPKIVTRPSGFGGHYVTSARDEQRERDLYETVPMYPDDGWERYEGYVAGMYSSFHASAQRLYDKTSFQRIADTPRHRALRQRVADAINAESGEEAHYCDSDELCELAETYGGYQHYVHRLAHRFVCVGDVPTWPAEELEAALGKVIEHLTAHERKDPKSDAWWWREDAEFLMQLAKVLRDATSEVQAEDHDAMRAE